MLGCTDNNTQGAGLSQVPTKQHFEIDWWAQYLLHHGHPRSQNFVSRIAMDITGQVHQGSIFGYILAHALAPTGAHAHAEYMRAFALVATCLHLYANAVYNFDQASSVPFMALDNLTFPLYRLHVEPDQVQNLGDTEVLWHLLAN